MQFFDHFIIEQKFGKKLNAFPKTAPDLELLAVKNVNINNKETFLLPF